MGCGAATCSGCCDDGGSCRGGRAALACGESGAACAACGSGTLCSAGACITVTQCDLSCGASCSGAAGLPCGADGGTCAPCASGELCAAGACVSASNTRWRLRAVSALVAPTRRNGDPWDDKSDPDPKLCANVGDAGQSCTLEVTDSFAPSWSTLFPPVFDAEQLGHVELSVIDVDYPGETVIEELGVLDLRPRWSGSNQQWTLDGASVSRLRLSVEPAP